MHTFSGFGVTRSRQDPNVKKSVHAFNLQLSDGVPVVRYKEFMRDDVWLPEQAPWPVFTEGGLVDLRNALRVLQVTIPPDLRDKPLEQQMVWLDQHTIDPARLRAPAGVNQKHLLRAAEFFALGNFSKIETLLEVCPCLPC